MVYEYRPKILKLGYDQSVRLPLTFFCVPWHFTIYLRNEIINFRMRL